MTSTATDLRDILQTLIDTALVETLAKWQEDYDRARMNLDAARYEVQRRLEERKGTVLRGAEHDAVLEKGTPTYDMGLLVALREQVTEAEWDAVVEETLTFKRSQTEPLDWAIMRKTAEEYRVQVQAKPNGTKLNGLERNYGANSEIGKVIQRSRIPGTPKVNVKARGEK